MSELDELLMENEDFLKSPDKKVVVKDDDSFDFENSDELNKIISKYEMQIQQNNSGVKKAGREVEE